MDLDTRIDRFLVRQHETETRITALPKRRAGSYGVCPWHLDELPRKRDDHRLGAYVCSACKRPLVPRHKLLADLGRAMAWANAVRGLGQARA